MTGLKRQPELYFKLLFREDELICTGNMYANQLVSRSEAILSPGEYTSANALHTSRADKTVTACRNFVIEFDSMPLDEQLLFAQSVGLPFTIATFSGSKSIHFIIALNEPIERATYHMLFKAISAVLQNKNDQACSNPSRFTRTAGAYRCKDGLMVEQHIVALGKRNTTFCELVEWLETHGVRYQSFAQEEVITERVAFDGFINVLLLLDIYQIFVVPPRTKNLFVWGCRCYEAGLSVKQMMTLLSDYKPDGMKDYIKCYGPTKIHDTLEGACKFASDTVK
jgi:hypothetical protein